MHTMSTAINYHADARDEVCFSSSEQYTSFDAASRVLHDTAMPIDKSLSLLEIPPAAIVRIRSSRIAKF